MTLPWASHRGRARAATLVTLIVALLLPLGLARAENQHAQATLSYHVAENAVDCPSRGELTDAVAARIGYDPFVEGAADATPVDVEVTFAHGEYEGALRLGGSRNLQSTSCRELVDSLAVAIALGIDPESALRPPASASVSVSASIAPPPPPPPASTPTRAPPPPPPPPPEEPRHTSLWLTPIAALGDTPSFTLGLAIGANFPVFRHLTIDWEVSSTLPSSVRIGTGDRGEASANLTQLLVGACLPIDAASFCATASGGGSYATGSDVDSPRPTLSGYFAMGLRAEYALSLTKNIFLRGALDGQVPFTRTDLRIDGASLWTTSPVVGRAGIGVGYVLR